MPLSPALPGRPRAGGRLARGPQLAAALAARLTARDRWLLRMLLEHRVLTTGQITDLAFGTTRASTARMSILYQLRAVDRFRPLAPAGSSPLHFVLDEAGAAVLAAEDGTTPADLGYRRDRAPGDRPVAPPRPRHRGQRGLHRPGRRRPRQRRPAGPGVLVVRAALRRHLGPRPPRRLRPLARPAPGAARPPSPTSSSSTTPAPRTCPGSSPSSPATGTSPPAPASPPPSCSGCRPRAARPRCAPGWPARPRTAPAAPPPPRRSPASRSPPPPPAPAPSGPAGAAWLPAGSPGPRLRLAQLAPPGAAAPPAEPGEPARSPARRPALASPRPGPARLARPARQLPGGRR